MIKKFEETIETKYCGLHDRHVTHIVKYQLFQYTGDATIRKAPIKIVCSNLHRTDCSDCDLVIGRAGKKYYE